MTSCRVRMDHRSAVRRRNVFGKPRCVFACSEGLVQLDGGLTGEMEVIAKERLESPCLQLSFSPRVKEAHLNAPNARLKSGGPPPFLLTCHHLVTCGNGTCVKDVISTLHSTSLFPPPPAPCPSQTLYPGENLGHNRQSHLVGERPLKQLRDWQTAVDLSLAPGPRCGENDPFPSPGGVNEHPGEGEVSPNEPCSVCNLKLSPVSQRGRGDKLGSRVKPFQRRHGNSVSVVTPVTTSPDPSKQSPHLRKSEERRRINHSEY
ncbi:hypothetical protein AAFF_G00259840 [Aldrovandia affinis]|uniref:Uncharacterized protein n=1 Tax=Aldrovandia affinis TaxID=143900 RepID=A0AAD7RCB4_9TELE|nr:hypothetical protein AAFF_G00259840 [Aldrovandia affinis]